MEAATVSEGSESEPQIEIETDEASSPVPLSSSGTECSNDDWKCAICMDYLLDPVETGCSHNFCRFCINRWNLVNPGRRCPICRGPVGVLRSLPELDATISAFLQINMAPEELNQRNTVRSQREAIPSPSSRYPTEWDDFDFDDSHESLENQLVSHALRNSLEAAETEYQLRSNPFLRNSPTQLRDAVFNNPDNPWTSTSTSSIINRLRHSIERLQEFQGPLPNSPRVDLDDDTSQHELSPRNSPRAIYPASVSNNQTARDVNADWERMMETRINRLIQMENQARETQFYIQQSEDRLLTEYHYRLRRVRSAYSRIREAQQDYHFHNDVLVRIHGHFANETVPGNGVDVVDQGHDFESEEYSPISTPSVLGGGRLRPETSVRNDDTESLSSPDFVHPYQNHPLQPNFEERHLYSQNSGSQGQSTSRRGRRTSSRSRRILRDYLNAEGLAAESETSTGILQHGGIASSRQSLRNTREELNLPRQQQRGLEADRDLEFTSQSISRFRSYLSSNFRSPVRAGSEFIRGESGSRRRISSNTNTDTGSILVEAERNPGTMNRRRSRPRSVQFDINREVDDCPDHSSNSSDNSHTRSGGNLRTHSSIGGTAVRPSRKNISVPPTLTNSTPLVTNARLNDDTQSTEQINILNNNNSFQFPPIRPCRRIVFKKIEKHSTNTE